MKKTDLSNTSRRLRRALGASQARISVESGLGLCTVQEIESGRQSNPSLRTLAALSGALGVSISELVGDALTDGRPQ